GNGALRALLDEAEMSNTGLATAVVAAAAREGKHVGTSTTSVKRMLDGCQPRWPIPRLVAAVLSRRLQREVSVTECGFADRTPAGEDPYDGLSCSGTLEGTVRTIVELSGRDMRRRRFLLGSAFSAAAFSEPALFALTMPPADSTSRAAGGRRIGMADVEVFTEQVTHLRTLECRYGSGRVRAQMVQLLHHEANELLHGSYSAKTGQALLGAVANGCWLAGYMAWDMGRHSLAQRYYIQGLDLAMTADDRLYAAYVLSQMSWMTVQLGHGAITEHDQRRNARQGVALARAGLSVASGAATPALAAQLHAMEARSLALLGDASAARRAVLEAERHYGRFRTGDEPPWLGFYTEPGFVVDVGCCLRDTGDAVHAAKLITHALDSVEPWKVSGRCAIQTALASAHLLGRDLELAAARGRDALRTAAEVSSTRALDRLRTLQRQVGPLRSASPHLADLDDRITAFVTRT
ncbi:MAG: hypothetical protein ACRDT0_07485, partial [Pseudonocardiaceae bacterium]